MYATIVRLCATRPITITNTALLHNRTSPVICSIFAPQSRIDSRIQQNPVLVPLLQPVRQLSTSSTLFATTFSKCTTMNSNKELIAQIREEFIRDYGGNGSGSSRFELTKDVHSGIGLLCIRNIEKKNCLNAEMMARLGDVLDEVQQWSEGKALVLYGENNFFCSGGDLNTIREIANPEGGSKMITLMQHNLARLASLPLITVAYVEGMALGGGAELMTACDYRIATRESVIGFVQARIGITTVWGGGARLVQILGYGKALNMIGTGRTLTGEQAAELGFVDYILPPKIKTTQSNNLTFREEQYEILSNAREYLKPFLQTPRDVLSAGKLVISAARPPLDEALRQEAEHALKVWGGPDHQRALDTKVNHKKTQQQRSK